MVTGEDIIRKALPMVGTYAYWYGGKGEKCSASLLGTLSKLYPNIYTTAYLAACKQDIKKGLYCIDCSGLVCQAYDVPMVGTTQFDKYFTKWYDIPKNGMIVWQQNHTGLYYNGYVIEARGKNYGVTKNRKYNAKEWSRIYYMKGVSYGMNRTAIEYLKCAENVIIGNYENGDERRQKVEDEGYDYKIVQKIVNAAMEGWNNG